MEAHKIKLKADVAVAVRSIKAMGDETRAFPNITEQLWLFMADRAIARKDQDAMDRIATLSKSGIAIGRGLKELIPAKKYELIDEYRELRKNAPYHKLTGYDELMATSEMRSLRFYAESGNVDWLVNAALSSKSLEFKKYAACGAAIIGDWEAVRTVAASQPEVQKLAVDLAFAFDRWDVLPFRFSTMAGEARTYQHDRLREMTQKDIDRVFGTGKAFGEPYDADVIAAMCAYCRAKVAMHAIEEAATAKRWDVLMKIGDAAKAVLNFDLMRCAYGQIEEKATEKDVDDAISTWKGKKHQRDYQHIVALGSWYTGESEDKVKRMGEDARKENQERVRKKAMDVARK